MIGVYFNDSNVALIVIATDPVNMYATMLLHKNHTVTKIYFIFLIYLPSVCKLILHNVSQNLL